MIPVGDFLRRNTTPYVNWLLIATNLLVFLYTISLSTTPDQTIGGIPWSASDRFYFEWSFMPACLADYFGVDSGANPEDVALLCPTEGQPLRVVSAMFMHAGWAHVIFNLLFLWLFGDNVEDRLGHVRYLIFYLVCGVLAALVQTVFSLDTLVPNVGASGAIAGVLGAYLILYPKAIVQVVILPLFFIPFFVPAVLLILVWFLTQLLSGLAEVGQTTAGSGTAWWAHIGGFIAGVLLITLIRPRGRPRSQPYRVT